jgi:lipoprotein-releasing system permease protein
MSLYELFVGFRYLKSKKSQKFISFNTILSVLIVALGVFILIVVTSVMNGFQSQIKDKILDVDAHITVTSFTGKNGPEGIKDYQKLCSTILNVDGVTSALPYLQGQGLFRFEGDIAPVMIRGMGPSGGFPAEMKKFITADGAKAFGKGQEVFIGVEMATNNIINIGDYIELIVPKGRFNAAEGMQPGLGRFKVIGYFKTGYYDFDTRMVIMSLPQAQEIFSVGDRVWGIGAKITDIYKMDIIARDIQRAIGFDFQAITAEQRNQNLFYALRLEKLIMTIILFLVIVSAGFTIMGTMVMVVMEKRKAVGVLKSMGSRPESIMAIFVLEGFLIGVVGTMTGIILGLAAALNLEKIILSIERIINSAGAWFTQTFSHQLWFDISIVPKNVYYIDGIPTEISPEFIVFIAVFAVFLATVSAVFPAWSASRLKPVETIRYE